MMDALEALLKFLLCKNHITKVLALYNAWPCRLSKLSVRLSKVKCHWCGNLHQCENVCGNKQTAFSLCSLVSWNFQRNGETKEYGLPVPLFSKGCLHLFPPTYKRKEKKKKKITGLKLMKQAGHLLHCKFPYYKIKNFLIESTLLLLSHALQSHVHRPCHGIITEPSSASVHTGFHFFHFLKYY